MTISISQWREDLIEKLAAIEHERWSGWYVWERENRTLENEARWNTQAITPYANLSEKEKDSDRREVMKYWPLIESHLSQLAGELTPTSVK
jgi:hypothetical protein